MNRFLGFAGTVAVIVIALVLLAGCGLGTILAYQWLSPDVTQVTTVDEQPVAVNPNSHAGGEATVCEYADGYDANGEVVKAGTEVKGPAFVKPDRNISWGYPVYVGETYVTKASDEVVWLLIGDNACVDSQSPFFTSWGKTKP